MEFHERPLVYVAHPYTNPDPVENSHKAIKIADNLHNSGLVTCVVPHLTLMWHSITPHPPAHWYAYDFALLRRCDALLRMPGQSMGADDEEVFAEKYAIPCFYSPDTLLDWAR